MLALPRRRAQSGPGRRRRNRGPSPVELVKGTGELAGLANGELDRSNLVRERGVIALSREEAIWGFQWGGGREKARS